jgi:hypothetical protein
LLRMTGGFTKCPRRHLRIHSAATPKTDTALLISHSSNRHRLQWLFLDPEHTRLSHIGMEPKHNTPMYRLITYARY